MILMLSPHLGPVLGGIQKDMLRQAREFIALGDQVAIVTTFDEFPTGRVDLSQPLAYHQPETVEVVRVRGHYRSRLRGFQPANPPLFLPGLVEAARRFEPDTVIFYNVGWPLTVLPALLALRRKTLVLYRTAYHGYDDAQRLDPLRRRLQLGVAGLSHRLLSYSQAEKAQIVKQGGIAPERIVPVYPGVEVPELARKEIDAFRTAQGLDGALVIAHVARLSRFKGTDRLMRILPELRRRSSRDVVLLLAGRNLEADYLRGLAYQLAVEPYVRFLGPVSERDLHLAYAAADLFALPSRYESFGLVFLEAMAHGLPVVGVATGGVPEVIRDGETGFVLDSAEDEEALAEALTRLVRDDALRARLGQQARRWARQRFSWPASASAVKAIIRDLGR